jgi:hypothetical protein
MYLRVILIDASIQWVYNSETTIPAMAICHKQKNSIPSESNRVQMAPEIYQIQNCLGVNLISDGVFDAPKET